MRWMYLSYGMGNGENNCINDGVTRPLGLCVCNCCHSYYNYIAWQPKFLYA